MGMPSLPDVPEDAYNSYQADQFGQSNQTRIDRFTFGTNNMARIAGLGMAGYEQPREFASTSALPLLPTQIPLPSPQIPQMPQLPIGVPVPRPAPAPLPAPAPPPPIGLPPTQLPTTTITPQAPEPALGQPVRPRVQPGGTQVPQVPGVPQIPQVPGVPQVPQVPGAEDTSLPMPSGSVPVGGDLRAYARQAATNAGIDPDIFVAQIQQESGFQPFQSSGKPLQSPAGAIGIAQFMPATAAGLNLDPTDPYAALDAAAKMDAQHLQQYGGDWTKVLAAYNAGPGAVAQYGGVPPYKETQSYVTTILGNAGKPAQQAAPPSGSALPPGAGQTTGLDKAASTALSTSQFGDRELTADEAYAACGPAAAVRFAQAYGRNPTLREAVDMAKEVGWTAQSGMAGIASEQKLLERMGIPTKLIGPDVQAMATEAQSGNPVTISTPGHYFYADGYNPATQQFHVGRSGLDLKGGAEWMTANQMQNLMGTVQGALLANNPTVAAPSSSTTPQTALDQVKQQATNLFSSLRAPTFGASRLPASNDPGVQQLNRAVEIASLPKAAEAPQLPDTAPASPLDNLGNLVGNAITSALSAVGLGGGPPAGPRQPQDQQDQNQQPEAVEGQADVGTRARQMIEQLQTLPGGMKLGQLVGAPDLLPPDTKNMSIADAIREAITRGGENALNLPRPSPGPGGLGIYDPRLGADPRLDIPDLIDPLARLLGGAEDVLGRGGQRAVSALEDVFGAERVAGMARGATEDLFGTPVGERAADVIGEILGSNVGSTSPVQQIVRDGQASAANGLSRGGAAGAWDNFVRLFVNSNVDLDHIEQDLQRRLGRPLTDSERVGLLARFDPTHQAETSVDQAIGPALRDIPTSALPDFYNLVENRTNQSAAEGLAKRAEQQALEGGIATRTQQRLDEANSILDQAQNAHAQALADQRAIDLGVHRTRESISLNAAGQRVRNAQAAVDDALETARDAAAAHAHEQTLRGPQGELVRRPEQRDLIIAESDARRANAAFDRMMAREPRVPIQPTGVSNVERATYERRLASMARQVGYAEDRVTRLRHAMGENVATREAAVGERAATAAQAAREAPRPAATPELAAARVRLRYEQQNLDRLQAAKDRGQQGLTDDLARAYIKVNKAQRDVDQATADLPEYARAQGWAQLTGREFRGPEGQAIHYPEVMQQIEDLRNKYADDPETWQKMQNGLQAIQDFRKQMLQERVDGGLIDQQTMDDLLNTYDFHTPTRMLDYINDEAGGLQRGSRFNVNDAGLRSYTPEGSALEHQNHVAALIKEADTHYKSVAKNRLVNALVDAQGGEGGELQRIASSVKEYVDRGGAEGPLLHPDYKPKPGKGEVKISAMIDGRKQQFVTSNGLIREMVKSAGGETSTLAKILQAPAHIVRETAVQRNPLFLPVNLARDAMAYALRQTAQSGYRGIPGMAINLGPAALTAATTSDDDPNRGQKIGAALALGMGTRLGLGQNLGLGPSAMRAYLSAFGDVMEGLGSGRMTGEQARELFQQGGGLRGGGWFGGGGSQLANADEALRRLTRGNAFTVRNAADLKQLLGDVAGFGWSKALGDRLEMVPRVASQQVALARGESPLQAAMRARDASVDFNKAGTLTREINRYVPFFNAGVQGTAQLGRLLRDNPKGALAAGLTLLGAPAAATESYNYSDPQRARDYEDEPSYLKNMGISIMLPGEQPRDAQGNRVPQKIFLPIPQEFMPFVIAGREAYKRMSGRGTPMSASDLAGAAAQNLLPLGSSGSAEGAIYGMVPSGPGTIAQLALNRDLFRGSTIANQYSDANASNLGHALAPILERAVNAIPGHEADRIHPSQVDFAIRDVGNGLGSTFLNTVDAATGRAARTPGAPSELPVIGSLASRFVRGTGGQLLENAVAEKLTPSAIRTLRSGGVEWQPSPVSGKIGTLPLLRDEQARLQESTNRYIDDSLQRAFRTSMWQRGNQRTRERLVQYVTGIARQRAQNEVLRSIPASERTARVQQARQAAA